MQNKSLHVILLEKKGYKYSLWLPDEKEGKYEFLKNENGRNVPISIVGKDGQWHVITKGSIVLDGTILQDNHCILEEQSFFEIKTEKSEYTLYVEDSSEQNRVLFPYIFDVNSEVIVGRDENCDIVFPNPSVSRKHISIYRKNKQWFAKDMGSLNGVYLNNKLIDESVINPGDVIFVMGLVIVCGVNYFAMNIEDGKAYINSHKVKKVNSELEVASVKPEELDIEDFFERSPRDPYKIVPKEIEIENPPMSMKGGKIPFMLRMGSSMVYGGSALLSGNFLMATTSLFLPGLTQGLTEKERKEYEEKRVEIYNYYLNEKKKEILQEKTSEEFNLKRVYPELSTVLDFANHKKRLWERRRFDEDFLNIRLGFSNLPMLAPLKYPEKKIEVERDELTEAMYSLAENKVLLKDAPVMLSLSEDYVIGLKGIHSKKIEFIRNFILQLAFTHSYDEVKVVLIGKRAALKDLDFVKYLPHNWSNDKDIRFYAETKSDVQQVSTYLNKVLEEAEERHNDVKKRINYVAIVLSKDLYDYIEPLKNVCESEKYKGISVIAAFDNMPKECRKLISLERVNTFLDLYNPENGILGFELDKFDANKAAECIREINKTKLKLDEKDYSLPTSVDFLEMYGINDVEHLNPLKRWTENDPTKSLAAPIGIGGDGKQFMLDLHEKKQGPHGLIAGGTGSGKSEFIISYILSMAINYSPDEVAFILIDYKGGGLADAFVDAKKGIHLPHVVGTITNLDGSAINRSLLSINSELRRRQTVFKNAKSETDEGTMDIYDYQKLYRQGKVSEPMPHLFIISDEFAELKKQQPEFMDELISTARIGRSLGVHLILATQKPSGVVNDQIWSNTKFRICLKVADRSDSQEMLKRPEAAEIKNTGRFYLQVGYNDFFAQGQAGWCGASYYPGEEKKSEIDDEIDFVDNVGQKLFVAKKEVKKKQSEVKQVVAIVKYLSELSEKEKITPKQLWCEPLAEKIELENHISPASDNVEEMLADIGVFDDPENQRQLDFKLNIHDFHHMLLVGPSGCGKSVFLKTMLYSLVNKYSAEDLNYYLVDFSRGSLSDYKDMPHCGAYITESDERNYDRLVKLITDIADDRKEKFLEEHVTSFEGYRKIKPMPVVLFIIDGYATLKGFKNGSEYHVTISELMKKCSSYGIKFILAFDRINDVYSRTRLEADIKIAFQAKDKYDYTDILETKCETMPPDVSGRGVAVYDEKPMEFHTYMLDVELNEFERGEKLKKRLTQLKGKWGIEHLAESLHMITDGETYEEFSNYFKPNRIPIGYALRDLKRVAMPFKQFHSMSVYMGNPAGKNPFIESMLYAAKKNDMRVVFMKKTINSFMDLEENQFKYLDVECMQVTEDNIAKLSELIQEELIARNVYRNEYCEKHNIPADFNGKAVAAQDYIMANARPLLIFFEGFGDLCRLDETEKINLLMEHFKIFFGKTKGYHMYFMSMFYPEEEGVSSSTFFNSYNPDGFSLFFGGRYDKQYISNDLPYDIRKEADVKENYDEFYMKYRDVYYAMKMPLGNLVQEEENEDIASIV